MITLEDVALKANLNKGSVSRILNGKGDGYSAETRQRVLDTAAEMGYRPNMLARALQTGRTNTVALWLLSDDYYSPYFGYLQHCIQSLGVKHEYQMITDAVPVSAHGQPKGSRLIDWPVDGIICSYMTRTSTAYLQSMVRKNIPLVCMQQNRPGGMERYPNADYVFFDVYDGAKQAMNHLLESGCRRVAFVTESHMYDGEPRGVAYRELMDEAGQPCEPIVVVQGTRTGGYEALKAHIKKHGCPDGLFCLNDEIAIGCYLAMKELGIQVPGDVLLVGFDGLENARLFSCPISSVSIPVERMCQVAWELLLDRIQNPETPTRQKTFLTQLEIRESSTPITTSLA